GVERRLQQSYGAPRFPLVAFPLAKIASDDHCTGDFTLTGDRRVRERELDRLTHLRTEDVLAIAHPALQSRWIIAIGGNEQVLELQADDVFTAVSEERASCIVGKANAAVAIAHEQQIAHRADDLRRRQLRSDRRKSVLPDH